MRCIGSAATPSSRADVTSLSSRSSPFASGNSCARTPLASIARKDGMGCGAASSFFVSIQIRSAEMPASPARSRPHASSPAASGVSRAYQA